MGAYSGNMVNSTPTVTPRGYVFYTSDSSNFSLDSFVILRNVETTTPQDSPAQGYEIKITGFDGGTDTTAVETINNSV